MKLREKKKINFKDQLEHTDYDGSEDEYKEESGAEEESDSMSEVEEEEEEEKEEEEEEVKVTKKKKNNNIKMKKELGDEKPLKSTKKKTVTKKKSPIIKKEVKSQSSNNKSTILMESDSSDNDNVDKSEKEILELQKAHFSNWESELTKKADFYKIRKNQLQNSHSDCSNEFEFIYDSDDTNSAMDIEDEDNTINTRIHSEKTKNKNISNQNTNTSSESYEEVSEKLVEIILKTLESDFMIPITKGVKKSYTSFLKSQIANNPNLKNELLNLNVLNSTEVNENNNDNTTLVSATDKNKTIKENTNKKNNNKNNTNNTNSNNTNDTNNNNSNNTSVASTPTATTPVTPLTTKDNNDNEIVNNDRASLFNKSDLNESINNEIVKSPTTEIPKKRKRGRPPKNKNASAGSSTKVSSNASTPMSASPTQSQSKSKSQSKSLQNDKNKNSLKITSFFNQVSSSLESTSPIKKSKRRKTSKSKAVETTENQTMNIQNYFIKTEDNNNNNNNDNSNTSISNLITPTKDVDNDNNTTTTTTTTTTNKNSNSKNKKSKNSNDDTENLDSIKLFKCNVVGSNYKCFFPSCNQSFNTSEDLIKHLASYFHDIFTFIDNRLIEKYSYTSGVEAMELYKKLPLEDNHYESSKKYNIMIANRKLDICLFEYLPLKLNIKRKEEFQEFKKSNITKNEKAKIYTPYPNKSYQIFFKKNVFEWKLMAYENIRPNVEDFEIVPEKKALQYLHHANKIDVKFQNRKSKAEELETVDPFQSVSCKNSDHLGYIFNTGGSVWGLDWCPIVGKETQYIAVGGFNGTTDKHYVIGEKKSEKGCIQLWNVGKLSDENNDEIITPFLDLIILHDYGYVSDLKWCPYGGYEVESLFEAKKKNDPSIKKGVLPRLGILAASFGDGSTKIFVIPHPHTLKESLGVDKDQPLYVKLTPILRFSHPDTLLWKCSWGHNKLLAVACTNGCIAVYNIQKLLSSSEIKKDENSDPYLFFPAHDACIQKVEFYDEMKAIRQHYWGKTIESEDDIHDPSLLISCSNDGKLSIYDLRDPWTNCTLVRLRAFFITTSWVPHLDSIILGTMDNDVRMLNLKESCEYDKNDQKHDEGVNKPIATKALIVHHGSLWVYYLLYYIIFIILYYIILYYIILYYLLYLLYYIILYYIIYKWIYK
ncbi:WD40 repeat-like protein [Anaeromyces robustus]|uniref:WD40 repeat-like protein n=1 Tax=Anaeromyces robustus TaxID=1754192 RepID=A0A1Y1X1C8_9FUNG|nr:WD40 repeat-like protein [Anaeromyces robustus]|eukprot:ORX79502.1 WD40 repeat-like protein [Anaeromyces robustus]